MWLTVMDKIRYGNLIPSEKKYEPYFVQNFIILIKISVTIYIPLFAENLIALRGRKSSKNEL